MNFIKFSCSLAFAVPLLAAPSQTLAQEAEERALEITGEIYSVTYQPFWDALEGEPSFPLDFRAVVVEDRTSATGDSGPFGGGIYENAVVSMTFEVYDENQNLLFSDTFEPSQNYDEEQGFSSIAYLIPDQEEQEVFLGFDNAMWIAAGPYNEELEGAQIGRITSLGVLAYLFSGGGFEFPEPEELPQEMSFELFADLSGYPLFIEGETFYPFQYLFAYEGESQQEQELDEPELAGFFAIADFIQYISLDADGDGVLDAIDQCPVTIFNETVEFAAFDTGLDNVIDEFGCSIMDRYAKCHAESEEEQSFTRRFSSFYRGPSYCEKQVAYGLVSDGLIDYSEARTLRDALYRQGTSVADNPLYEPSTQVGENPLYEDED
jgi:hypothetical protein